MSDGKFQKLTNKGYVDVQVNTSPSTDLAWAEARDKGVAEVVDQWFIKNGWVPTEGRVIPSIEIGKICANFGGEYEAKRAEVLVYAIERALEGDGEIWDKRNRDRLESALSAYTNGSEK